MTVQAGTLINAPLTHMICHFAEADLFKNVVSNAREVHLIKEFSNTRKCMQVRMDMPFPVTNREMLSMAKILYIREKKAFLNIQRSIHTPTVLGVEMPPETKDFVRVDLKKGFHCFMKIDENTTRYTNMQNNNPKLQMAPSWVMNKMIEKVSGKQIQEFD